MRTPLLLAALALALLAPAAAALGLPAARVDVHAAGAHVTTTMPPDVALPEMGADAIVLPAPLPLLAPLESAPLAPVARLPAQTEHASLVAERDAAPTAPPAAVQTAAAGGLLWLLLEKLGLGRALGGAIAALYFRVQPNELLDHERRERVVKLVRERPGIGPSELAQEMGMGWGVTSYHLDRLERAGLVTSQRVGQHRCYFVPGAVPRDAQEKVGLFRADTTRRVAQLVRQRPGIAQRELAAALGLSASATSKQLSRLETAALVRRESGAGGLRLYPEPALSSALEPMPAA